MPISLEKIEALAPDQASLDAARKLLKTANWPSLATDGGDLVWGECQGSGSTPYRVVVCESDAGYKCSCPSRKFPCKHSLALMWFRAEGKQTFAAQETPPWVQDWVSRRRGPSVPGAQNIEKPKASIADTHDEVEQQSDPKSAARAAAAREKNLQEREAGILAGLDELDVWLSDQIENGLANFVIHVADSCRVMAQRLVDARAPGLATRLDSLPGRLFGFPDPERPLVAVKELAQFHLLAEAYRRQNLLGDAVKADVRQMVGWNIQREQLLADPGAIRVSGRWRIVATRRVTQPDRLIRQETWLIRQDEPEPGPQFALLLDFVPVAAAGSKSPYFAGEIVDAELCFYPGIIPLRALISRQNQPSSASEEPLILPDMDLVAAWSVWEERLVQKPWLDSWPLAFNAARVRLAGDGAWLTETEGSQTRVSIPFARDHKNLFALARLNSFGGIGLWDGHGFRLWWAETSWGTWRPM